MRTIFFEPFAGISGDMCLGALVDAGCPFDELKAALAPMEVPQFDLRHEKVMKGPLAGTKVHVIVQEEPKAHRKLGGVLEIVDKANFPAPVRERIEAVFTSLAKAEGRVHGKAFDAIHFHEVGCYDAIIDVCGTVMALHLMGIERVACGKVHVGEGFVTGTRHGTLPLPAPATAYLLENFEIYSTGRNVEMVTPTGAALMTALAHESSHLPSIKLQSIGYGAGTRDAKDLPNMLRVFIGEDANGKSVDMVTVIETNIDDMNPEHFDVLIGKLYTDGAVDVTLSPLQMKKNRPGTLLSAIVPIALREKAAVTVLRESSAIGVRMTDCHRRILQRQECTVETQWGAVKGKVCWGHGVEKRFTPEYDECKRICMEKNVPLQAIYQAAMQAFKAMA